MKESIDKILHVSQSMQISCNQGLFLLAVKEGIYSVDLPAEELMDLVKRGYMKSNRVTQDTLDILNKIVGESVNADKEKRLADANYPKLTRDSGAIIKAIAKHLYSDKEFEKEKSKLANYINNPIALPFLHLFLSMFPTSNEEKNKKWKKHFGENGSGVTLRKLSAGTIRKFNAVWKKKDIGIFLLGTYLFICESYSEKQDVYYVKSLENYFSEWEHWYQEAEDKIAQREYEHITKKRTVKSDNNNTTML